MPEGWMVGRDGLPLTDPKRRDEGFMLPIGGPKGFGLSVAIGLLAGVLNGAAFGADVVDFTREAGRPTNTGQFVAAIDIEAFGSLDAFTEAADRAFAEMRRSTPLPGHEAVRLPGDGKAARRAQMARDGMALHPSLLADLDALADEIGIPAL
jgi:LDH2 family malate/lactate/ureidoglycolate dehydrogenase